MRWLVLKILTIIIVITVGVTVGVLAGRYTRRCIQQRAQLTRVQAARDQLYRDCMVKGENEMSKIHYGLAEKGKQTLDVLSAAEELVARMQPGDDTPYGRVTFAADPRQNHGKMDVSLATGFAEDAKNELTRRHRDEWREITIQLIKDKRAELLAEWRDFPANAPDEE